MAKMSVVNRNKKRARIAAKHAAARLRLKKRWLSADASEEEKRAAFFALQRLPRDSSATRYRIRCELTGRPRGVFRRFGMGRNKLREMAMNGEVPGVIKASW